jgi:glyoxylase-like metal-dependent hydrolase (beta-lactamase superfamily II)/rhodanese-related sulfurtransferase
MPPKQQAMVVEQIYTGCLAQGAYYIQSEGEAAVIDPLREVQPYINKALKEQARIKYVFETHFHADFVSGHIDLAQKTGASIVYGPTAKPHFDCHIATDGEVFSVGKIKIKALHTPGHTLESTCYLIFDEQGNEYALLSGDTLFIGDVGRPDLAQKSSLTMDDLAGMLFDSLNTKIKTLPDHLIIYPAHGAGSACGKNMSKETFDTLGRQKQFNYALRASDKAQFIKEVTDGLPTPPAYFPQNVQMNKEGYASFDKVLRRGLKALTVEEFEGIAEVRDALVLDTRSDKQFFQGFIPNSINISLGGQFAPWVGALVADVKQPILLITDIGKENETVTRLSRVGFDVILGYLNGGFESWKNAKRDVETIDRIPATDFLKQFDENSIVIDVRREGEYSAEHLHDAYNKPLDVINDWTDSINRNEHFFLHCAGGFRSMIAGSILKARGIHNFTEIAGGFTAMKAAGLPCSSFVCQSV